MCCLDIFYAKKDFRVLVVEKAAEWRHFSNLFVGTFLENIPLFFEKGTYKKTS